MSLIRKTEFKYKRYKIDRNIKERNKTPKKKSTMNHDHHWTLQEAYEIHYLRAYNAEG